ncbi:FAD-dependent monooxygenase [Saccharopolyspora sp. K220]|uniref:FAD-dependent oxidoreductase n=1 Tax=Saccharopolyspora soli TaxID=2926618 RepID=UPI001F56F6BE|nr:FAD-dependent monooxygenase [Saccharopolyspora soli]MCI2421810.1 FAD-dependent monooxygenase [Saccharopolyspora soli]
MITTDAGGAVMHVVIVGGGIAGTAAALALDKAGFSVSVHEAHADSGADIGAFLTLADNGMRALREIGVVPQAGFPLTALRLTGSSGEELAVSALGGAYRCVRRAELCELLQAEVRSRGLRIEHGARFVSAEQDGDRVVARFADGREAAGDLLIGADGLNSAVRALLDPVPKRYAGQQVFYGYSDRAEPPHEPEHIEMVRGSGSSFGYAVSPEGRTYWFARLAAPPLDGAETAAAMRTRLLAALRPDATPTADIVAATDDVLVTNAHDLVPTPRWRSGRVLLIGDAAHAASPATGQGASMAFEDAVVLAKSLRDNLGLDGYERLRRPRVERNIVRSAQLTAALAPDHVERGDEVERLRLRHGDVPAEDDPLGLLDWDAELPS